MFGDLNRAEIIGNITNDVQVRYTGNGNPVTSFGVATNRRYKSPNSDEWKEETTFHNVVVWGSQAEQLARRAKKGTRVFVSGRLQTRSWEDGDGKKNYKTEITSQDLILLDRYERGSLSDLPESEGSAPDSASDGDPGPGATSSKSSKGGGKSKKKGDSVIDPDDLPF
ncbi:MAG: single-stranded DNA-binding protein [Candidatus Dojkabacteria bacterium]